MEPEKTSLRTPGREGSDDLDSEQIRRIQEGVGHDAEVEAEAGLADLRTPREVQQDDRSNAAKAPLSGSAQSAEQLDQTQHAGNGATATLEAAPAVTGDTVMTHFAEKQITGADEAHDAMESLEDFDRSEMEDMIGGN